MNSSTNANMEPVLRIVAFRMWLAGCLESFTKTIFAVAAMAILLAVARSMIPFPHLALTSIAFGCGLLWFVWKAAAQLSDFRNPLTAARQIDRKAGLNNRITTAVEASNSDSTPIQQLLLQDAIESISAVNPQTIVPLPSAASPIMASLALIGAMSLLIFSPLITPTTAAEQTIQTSHDPANLNRLVDILKAILTQLQTLAADNSSEELDALIHDTQETLQAIQEGDLTTSEAYLQLSKLQQQMLNETLPDDATPVDPAWQKVAAALSSSKATDAIADLLHSQQFQKAAAKMAQLDSKTFADDKLNPAEVTSLTEKLDSAAAVADDKKLGEVLKDLSSAIADGKSDTANQKMQDLAAETAKYQVKLDQAKHLDDLSEQLELGKMQLAISSNSSGDGQMGGKGLNKETGRSKGKGGADSQKAGAKTAGNIDGPKADLKGQKQLAELQGQFGEEGLVEVKTKSTDERPDLEINRRAQSVITEYSRQIEADLKQQQVPPGHTGIVRKYFESIRPATDVRK